MDDYMDGYLKNNLTIAKEMVKQDLDIPIVIDGSEGSGKSVIAQQCAKYCDETFNIDRIAFTPTQFIDIVKKAEKFQAVVFDEALSGLSSRETMTEMNRALVKMMAEVRQKNLFVFIVLPSFMDLDKNIALWRTRALIHVYFGARFKRGFFCFFNEDRKKQLYVYGKKLYNYSKPPANFIGRFSNRYEVDEMEYRRRKLDAFNKREKQVKSALFKAQRDRLLQYIYNEVDLTEAQLGAIIGLEQNTVSEILRNMP